MGAWLYDGIAMQHFLSGVAWGFRFMEMDKTQLQWLLIGIGRRGRRLDLSLGYPIQHQGTP
jgi:hypothetical protein